MLVLSRRPGEELRVGDDIIFKVISVRGDNVRIGIDAPRDINIIRSELGFSSDYRTTFKDDGPSTEDTGIWPSDGSESGNDNNKG